jgi:hypothetical protein
LTANQTVAHNLRRARLARDWTLEETTTRLEPHLGEKWTTHMLSTAEGSRHGKRIRKFDADLLAAFAACFEVPVSYFFEESQPAGMTVGGGTSTREEDVAAVLRQTAELLERLAAKEER